MSTVDGTWYPQSSEVLIWNVDDVIKLRKDYRIIGCYLGQDHRSTGGGLPLRLTKNEVSLLLEEKVLRLAPYNAPHGVRATQRKWTHPQSEQEVMKYIVFRDLWRKGHYITPGIKFGGDFLVYPGDPALYHAHLIAIVHSAEEGIPLQKLSVHGRVGTMVKKTVLWCSLDERGQPFYVSQNKGDLELP